MFLRPFIRLPATLWMAVLLVLSLIFVWKQQQPQPIKAADVATASALQCVSYSPYYKEGMNPTVAGTQVDPAQIDVDLQALSKLTRCVRTYSVSQGMDYVPKAASKLGMQVIVGAWVGWLHADNRHEIEQAVTLANTYPETVRALVIGNEVLLRGEQPESKMREYLQWVKAHTRTPATYADVWEFWLKHPALEQEVDFVTVHILPYWEDRPVAIAQAVAHTTAVMDKLGFAFKKPLLIGETGWPSQGRQRFGAAPGVVNQARYLREFVDVASQRGWQYNVIEAVDQPWKRALEGTVGGYWGLMDTDLQPKFAFSGPVAERQDGVTPYLLALGLAVVGAGLVKRRQLGIAAQVLAALTLATLGLHGFLQLDYIRHAARSPDEYLMLGGLAILGWAMVLYYLQQWLGCQDRPSVEQALLSTFVFALLLTSASLAIDGRYRDFPLLLTILPVAVTLVAMLRTLSAFPAEHIRATPATWWLGVLALFATNLAVSVAMLEFGNYPAWAWSGLCGVVTLVFPVKAMCLSKQSNVR